MAKIGLPKGSGKRLKVREKSVKSQGILKWILSGNPVKIYFTGQIFTLNSIAVGNKQIHSAQQEHSQSKATISSHY